MEVIILRALKLVEVLVDQVEVLVVNFALKVELVELELQEQELVVELVEREQQVQLMEHQHKELVAEVEVHLILLHQVKGLLELVVVELVDIQAVIQDQLELQILVVVVVEVELELQLLVVKAVLV